MNKSKLLELAKANGSRPSIEKTVDMIYSLKGVPIISEVERCHMVRALLWSIGFDLVECVPLAEKIVYGAVSSGNAFYDLEGDEIYMMDVGDLPSNFVAGRPPSLDISGE